MVKKPVPKTPGNYFNHLNNRNGFLCIFVPEQFKPTTTSMLTKFKPIRRLFYKTLISYVRDSQDTGDHGFLCHYQEYHPLPWTMLGKPCWKDMEEVQELSHSEHIIDRKRGKLSCVGAMFHCDNSRIAFLQECIQLLDTKE